MITALLKAMAGMLLAIVMFLLGAAAYFVCFT